MVEQQKNEQPQICEHTRRIHLKLRRELGKETLAYLNDPEVIEIMLNPDGQLWVEKLGEPMRRYGYMLPSQAESLMGSVASEVNTQITPDKPILECEFPLDGSRFEGLIPPVVSKPTFTIRKKALRIFTLNDYLESGVISSQQCLFLKKSIKNRKNILVVGGTSSGKTTFTNAIIHEIGECTPDNRIVIIEDISELQCSMENSVQLRATCDVDMIKLLKATMRLRPDRILIGEVRDGAAHALLKAWNTGHEGGAATIHANTNSYLAGLIRLHQLVCEAPGASENSHGMELLIAEAVDVIVTIEKTEGGRRVKEIVEVNGYDGKDYIVNVL